MGEEHPRRPDGRVPRRLHRSVTRIKHPGERLRRHGSRRPGGSREAAHVSRVRLSAPKRWERRIVVLIGVVTSIAAVLTYLAVDQESDAVEKDRQAVLETAQVERDRVAAETRAHAEAGFAARYLRALAEVSALEQQAAQARAAGDTAEAAKWTDAALLLRTTAESAALLTIDKNFLKGEGAAARYDDTRRRDALLKFSDGQALPAEAPKSTAERANELHASSERLVAWVVVLFGAVVMLTTARLAARRWQFTLVAASVVLSGCATVTALAEWALVKWSG